MNIRFKLMFLVLSAAFQLVFIPKVSAAKSSIEGGLTLKNVNKRSIIRVGPSHTYIVKFTPPKNQMLAASEERIQYFLLYDAKSGKEQAPEEFEIRYRPGGNRPTPKNKFALIIEKTGRGPLSLYELYDSERMGYRFKVRKGRPYLIEFKVCYFSRKAILVAEYTSDRVALLVDE